MVNRVGDFGFLLGIAAVLYLFNTLDYATIFAAAPGKIGMQTEVLGFDANWITVICLLLFVGAMGKSAQVPLHVWLPDSMEGPTPISALIHAATMVTAGIFMVARMSPLYELSETALSSIMIIGAITAFFMGLIGIVQNDIKRVVAYSTLSQLGYMTVALGASAYNVAIFHLGTHAFFKALLFLGAGSVIIAMHHEQDMRKMGGLKRYMPITYWTCIIGSLALAGIPPFAGFFSKDAIIEAVKFSTLPGAGIAYLSVLSGVFITAFYSFRLVFLTFHGECRMDAETKSHLHESSRSVTLPLVLLAIPSIFIGMVFAESMIFGDYFSDTISIFDEHNGVSLWESTLQGHSGAFDLVKHAPFTYPFWLALGGIGCAVWFYLISPSIPAAIEARFKWLHTILINKYGIDTFYQTVFAGGSRALGQFFWKVGDVSIIDGFFVNGTARAIGLFSNFSRGIQSGFVYHYAFAMIVGLLALMTWYLWL